MHSVRKLFFVPVGLPGMGKSTLAKHIRQATAKNLQGGKADYVDPSSQPLGKRDFCDAFSGSPNVIDGLVLPDVDFEKISYDSILGDNTNAYQQDHPETPFHEIIDIIRDKAD